MNTSRLVRMRVMVLIAAVLLAACTESSTSTEAATAEPSPSTSAETTVNVEAEPAFFQPKPKPEESTQGPFWSTTFAVLVPEGHWEAGDGYDCRPINEGDYAVVSDQGVQVAVFDLPPQLIFGRTDSILGGTECFVVAVTSGDFDDDLGNGYTILNGTLSASFTPEEFFSGQGDGPNTVKPLMPT